MTRGDHDFHVAIVQCDIAIGQPEVNWMQVKSQLNQIMEDAHQNKAVKPDVIMLPEMWNIGYALREAAQIGDQMASEAETYFSSFCKMNQVHIVAGSIASVEPDGIYNRALIFNRQGERIASYGKMHLFRLMDEDQYLRAGNELCVFELDGIRCGIMICYDLRFPELSRSYALQGVELLFLPAQWPHPRLNHWRTLQVARSIENQFFVVSCNRVGQSGDTVFCGHSAVIDPWGERIVEGSEEACVLRATIDRTLVANVRKKIPIFSDRRPDCYTLDARKK